MKRQLLTCGIVVGSTYAQTLGKNTTTERMSTQSTRIICIRTKGTFGSMSIYLILVVLVLPFKMWAAMLSVIVFHKSQEEWNVTCILQLLTFFAITSGQNVTSIKRSFDDLACNYMRVFSPV
ncbi:hypothetical protein H5410_060181 [Solanum commersonii]|uniref:Uncharacterized protein n=1 Tax=Solanum commersonii TaxID=4109 RepID=A0A9J5W4V6_SOLCO|nr:hypothetical protein H5410_060181 [Solanum commersonii]